MSSTSILLSLIETSTTARHLFLVAPTMAIHQGDTARLRETLTQVPQVSIFLRPIAPPAALGLAGFAGSTWITASWCDCGPKYHEKE